jgi:Kef-type K+ transport system membrane component KefB
MTLAAADFASLLLAVGLLLGAAHAVGHLFTLMRQPRVIGEILGGLLLGPTVFGVLAPELQAAVFPTEGPVASVLGWNYQIGLLLLMFASGAEMRSVFRRDESRVVGLVTVVGVVLPFAAGLLLFQVFDSSDLLGTAGNETALLLVFGLAIAVTSIPVISRIMFDLGIIETSFARIVLGVAVIEDVIVYVVLALALGMVTSAEAGEFGVPGLLGLEAGTAASMAFHVVATLAFFIAVLAIGARLFRWSRRQRWNLVASSNPLAYHLLFIFGGTLACVLLGITPMFGAFLAGIAASVGHGPRVTAARESIKTFSFAFFIPVYFAIVGLQLDLVRHFDPLFFAWFLLFACVAKAASVYLGARVAGESPRGARNLAVATNARGGPGIVLASVTYAAGIISQEFFASLVMLAIVTSLLAGSWLGHVVRTRQPLRDERPRPHDEAAVDAAEVPSGEAPTATTEAPSGERGAART